MIFQRSNAHNMAQAMMSIDENSRTRTSEQQNMRQLFGAFSAGPPMLLVTAVDRSASGELSTSG